MGSQPEGHLREEEGMPRAAPSPGLLMLLAPEGPSGSWECQDLAVLAYAWCFLLLQDRSSAELI